MLRIFTDGGARGNPGPSACAFVVYKEEEILFQDYKYLGEGTNNFAEYNAVIFAYEWLIKNVDDHFHKNINFFLDSELLVKQLTGVYKIKNTNLAALAMKVKEFERKIGAGAVTYTFVRREQNKVADKLVNQALDEKNKISRLAKKSN